MVGEVLLEAVRVSRSYPTPRGPVQALVEASLSVRRGEIVAVVGPSGCGKTTLLNCLSGLDDVDEGRVLLEGREIHSLPDDERTRLRCTRIGIVFQSFNLIPVLTALENVELPLLVSGCERKEAERRAKEALEEVGLGERRDHRPAELSGGEAQRVAVARALVVDPAIVFADEPTGNLDSRTGAELLELIHRLNRERGQTYLIVTHDSRIASRATRVIRMENGRIVEGHT